MPIKLFNHGHQTLTIILHGEGMCVLLNISKPVRLIEPHHYLTNCEWRRNDANAPSD